MDIEYYFIFFGSFQKGYCCSRISMHLSSSYSGFSFIIENIFFLMLWIVGWCWMPFYLMRLMIFLPFKRASSLLFLMAIFFLYCKLKPGWALEVWPPMLVNFSKVLLQPGNLHLKTYGCSEAWGTAKGLICNTGMSSSLISGVHGSVKLSLLVSNIGCSLLISFDFSCRTTYVSNKGVSPDVTWESSLSVYLRLSFLFFFFWTTFLILLSFVIGAFLTSSLMSSCTSSFLKTGRSWGAEFIMWSFSSYEQIDEIVCLLPWMLSGMMSSSSS